MLSSSRSITAPSAFHPSGSVQTGLITVFFGTESLALRMRRGPHKPAERHQTWTCTSSACKSAACRGNSHFLRFKDEPTAQLLPPLHLCQASIFWNPLIGGSSVGHVKASRSLSAVSESRSARLKRVCEMTNQHVGGCIYSFCVCSSTKSCSRSSIK